MERLDYLLASTSLHQYITIADIQPASEFDTPIIGKGYWKMHVSHLQRGAYKERISEVIKKNNEDYQDIKQRWEMLKMAVHGSSLQYGARKVLYFDSREQNLA